MSPTRDGNSEAIVTFTGGLGAQILSAALYFYLESVGRRVYADLQYFETPGRIATEHSAGEVSHWNYELGGYGLPLNGFATKKRVRRFLPRHRPEVLADGERKLELAIKALRRSDIVRRFAIPPRVIEECRQITGDSDYLCIHIRRGDYLNVASHMMNDKAFLDIARSLNGIVKHAVAISDSDLSEQFREALRRLFPVCSFIVQGDLHVAHALLRRARYLICSNSQFSLTAALLSEAGQLVFVPTKWFDNAQSNIQVPIDALCRFQLLEPKQF